MKQYIIEVQYQSESGNPCARRFKIKAEHVNEAFDKASSKARRLKNFGSSMGGDVVEEKEIRNINVYCNGFTGMWYLMDNDNPSKTDLKKKLFKTKKLAIDFVKKNGWKIVKQDRG